MNRENTIRKLVLENVKKFYAVSLKESQFIAGTDYVHYAGRVFDENELVNLVDSSLDFWLTSGRYAGQFEQSIAAYLGVKHCMLTNSGSSANLLAMSALTSPLLCERQLKPGDEVITIACGFPTTLNPIIQNNLVPVFIDIEPGTYNIQIEKIEKAITRKTKALFLPHTLGNPMDIDAINRIVKKYGLWFIEDNCDALGSTYKGLYTGSFGHISTLSFYPGHHITMGEGGALLTNDPLLRKIILSLRDWGRECWCEPGHDDTCRSRFDKQFGRLPLGYDHKYVYSHVGYNLKITDMQAAVGVAQLKKLPALIAKRKENFKKLRSFLKKYEKYFILPVATKNSDPSWFGFTLLVKEDAPFTRMDIVRYLDKHKVATRMLFGGNLTKQPAYEHTKYRVVGGLKYTDLVMNNLFWVGVYPGITKEKMHYMLNIFEKFLSQLRSK